MFSTSTSSSPTAVRQTISQTLLHEGLQIVYRASSARSPMPALMGILLEGKGDRLRLAATDLELAIECQVATPATEAFRIVLPQRYLLDLVRRLPGQDLDVEIDHLKQTAHFSWNGGDLEIHGLDAREFPEFPVFEKASLFEISAARLRQLIRETSFAAASSDVRPILTGCLFEAKNGTLEVVATDGFRVAWSQAPVETPEVDVAAVVPVRALNELSRLLPDDDTVVRIEASKSQAAFHFRQVSLITRLLEGQFPLYRQVIPNAFPLTATFDSKDFIATAERASLLAEGDSNPVRLRFFSDKILLQASTPEVGKVEEAIPAHIQGEEMEIVFNVRFLLEGLKALGGEQTTFELSGTLSPARLRRQGDEDAFYLVLPIRTT